MTRRHPRAIALILFWLAAAVPLLAVVLTMAAAASRRVLLPVRRLAGAAQRMSDGDLSVRIESRGRDELAQLVTTFNAMAGALEDKVGELARTEARARQFAGDVSHELRTPLTAMTAVADLLGEQPVVTGDAGIAADLVSREIHHLNRLVDDLIEVSRFDAGTAELIADDIDIAVAVDRCLRVRNWTNVDTDVPPGLTVPLDRRRFDVVVANLVGNALRHGSAPVSLRASIEPDEEGGKELVVEVRDHGQGLAPAAAARVFDRSYKTDSARARSEGSGLGLAIAQENARLHGGRIDAGNHPGGGAAFTMRLPAHRPWREGAATPEDILAVGDAQPSASNMVTAAVSSAFALLWVLLAVLILAMVVCWVMAPAVAAAAIAFPAAIYLHALTVESIGTITGSGVPASATTICRPTELLVLAASGLVVAAAGALLPASWAAVSETTTALHAE